MNRSNHICQTEKSLVSLLNDQPDQDLQFLIRPGLSFDLSANIEMNVLITKKIHLLDFKWL